MHWLITKKIKIIILIAVIIVAGIVVSYFPFHVLANGFARYGYWIVLLGAFFEGEVVLLAAGVFAYLGYFNIWLVILIGFLGIIAGDNFQYYLGRKLGKNFLEKYSCFKKINNKFNNHISKILLGSRFMFGTRIACMMMAGANKISWKKFFKFNAISGIIWVIIVALLGFVCGASFVSVKRFMRYGILLTTLLIGLGILIYYLFFRKKS